jgi:hypothetical protein
MSVRRMVPGDAPSVQSMMLALWPDAGAYDFGDETVFVWQCPDGVLGGFASVSVRPWAEGCDAAPVPYIEGWYVAPRLRGQGIGHAGARVCVLRRNAREDVVRGRARRRVGPERRPRPPRLRLRTALRDVEVLGEEGAERGFLAHVDRIADTIGGASEKVRLSMGTALMGIGKRSAALNKAALKVARDVGPIEFTSASGECEPFDVAKHLTSDRLKEKLGV